MKEEHKSTEKEEYESPVMEIIEIEEKDIIFASPGCAENSPDT